MHDWLAPELALPTEVCKYTEAGGVLAQVQTAHA